MSVDNKQPIEAKATPLLALEALRYADRVVRSEWPKGNETEVEIGWESVAPFEMILVRAQEFLTHKAHEDILTRRSRTKVDARSTTILKQCESLVRAIRSPQLDPGEEVQVENTKEAQGERQRRTQEHQRKAKRHALWRREIENAHATIGASIDELRADLIEAGVHPVFTQAAEVFAETSVVLSKYEPLFRALLLDSTKSALESGFSEQAKKLESSAESWRKWGVGSLLALIVVAMFAGVAADWARYENVWFARLAIGTPVAFLSLYWLRQAATTTHLAQQYRFRQSLAKVVAAFGEVVERSESDENREYMKEVVLMMFTPPSFTLGKTTVEQSIKSVQGVVDSVQKMAIPTK